MTREDSLLAHKCFPHMLEYFTRAWESDSAETAAQSVKKWDGRAKAWEKDYNDPQKRKSDDRVRNTAEFLRERGLLGPDCDVADIGCGPGRFAVEFARTARHVTAIDLSARMIEQGVGYAARENLSNITFLTRDFRSLDPDGEDLTGRFDLVFSSITPAIHGVSCLEKLTRMSRKYCCVIEFIHSENDLESRIMRSVFGRDRPAVRDSRQVNSLFNLLYMEGYFPEVTCYKRHQELEVEPGPERVAILMELLLKPFERTPENEKRVVAWLREHAGENGLVREVSDTWYGRVFWDVRERRKDAQDVMLWQDAKSTAARRNK